MSKDAYYFKHDANASRDLKILQIRAIYGYEGIGFYWAVIEVLREQSDYKWDEKQSGILAKVLDIDSTRFSTFLADCKRIGLLKCSEGKFFSERLCYDMEVWESKRVSGRSGGLAKSKQSRSEMVSEYLAKTKRNPNSIGEDSKGEDRRLKPPTKKEAQDFMTSCGGNKSQGEKFWLHYNGTKGWEGINDWTSLAQKWLLTDRTNGKHEIKATPVQVIK